MSGLILHFPKEPIRAIVVIPAVDSEPGWCTASFSGWPSDYFMAKLKGPLSSILWQLQNKGYRQGLPITVHPDCKRRAAA
ncbi:hypothetical protein [Pontixanthobacter gangjinensis]|uniref:Uncharacterized protein n=1 Tax=Pontixanthobacter gangjinensis TaxID=1028742 RepID=A0A6I4SMP7_9SPHN|nr:hypothetical protein [Pontixanthobacter gangjinensis]MXO57181.1 hypothetical protein [Pontixanthobacter gangjinensis]